MFLRSKLKTGIYILKMYHTLTVIPNLLFTKDKKKIALL